MKRLFLGLTMVGIVLLSACGSGASRQEAKEAPLNALTEQEKAEGWILLFDGETFDGWRGYGREDIPSAWIIEDDAIKIQGSGAGEAGHEDGGDIIFDQQFQNFELTFEWKVSRGGNSGVFYLAQEIEDLPIWRSAPEYQILDNVNHLDARLGVDGNRKSASLYDLIPAKPQNSKPYGEWNTGSVIVYRGTVVHFQNGENVVEYHLWTPAWEEMVENSKFAGWEEFINAGGENRMGYIGLQDHGDDVWFRNLKLKILD
ncbi:3-keto-disaccharide hydrolase [Natronoflexus pectinivorans]|uniref:Uncharacterized protein DUF1080 n=1 Tax=Natronoflexus pectinivorans TaxID=682526 RepID=A0A4R2GJJ7_9BACT|nr:DUF1080 domain-containing protein [Natronoflexus pectinivorans]TCO08911.1 uncharacterized protein DUF1080 [Natronoflexus pectinivorans]